MMPGYVVIVAASAGLAFFVQTTTVQQQPVPSQMTAGGVTQSETIANAVYVGAGIAEMPSRRLTSIPTPVSIVASENHRGVRIAKAVGGMAAFTFLLFILLSAMHVRNSAIWLPALPALVGLMAMAGAYIERLER